MNDNIFLTSKKYLPHNEYWSGKAKEGAEGFEMIGNKSDWSILKEFNTVSFILDKTNRQTIRRLTNDSELETFIVLLSGFYILLSKYYHKQVIGIKSPFLDIKKTEDLSQTLIPLIQTIDTKDQIKNFVLKLNETVTNAYKYQNYPISYFSKNNDRVFHTNVYIAFPSIHPVISSNNEFDLEINISKLQKELSDDIELQITYNTLFFDDWFIYQMISHYNNVILCFNNLSKAVSEIEIFSDDEKRTLLSKFNNTRTLFPQCKTIVSLFEEQVKQTPNAIAIVSGNNALTYRELHEKSDQLSACIKTKYNPEHNTVIGLMMDRSEWIIIGILGILKSGNCYMPVDVTLPQQRIDMILQDAGVKILIIHSKYLFNVDFFKGDLFAPDIELNNFNYLGEVDSWCNPEDLAYLIYTSGSTGQPKGISISHRSLLNTEFWRKQYYGFDSSFVTLQFASFSFDSSVNDIFSMLLWGGALVILSEEEKEDFYKINALISKHKATNFNVVPSFYNALIEDLDDSGSSLKVVTLAGEKLSIELIKKHSEKFPYVKIINEYGPTENSICSSACIIDSPNVNGLSIGKPIANTEFYILGENLELLPLGVIGELCISGAGLSNGYLNQEELTKKVFIANPFKEGERMYKTGDLGRWQKDGSIEYLGRKDDQVKIRGYRVELGEIESVLQQHFEIERAVVVVYEEKPGIKQLVAYIVTSTNIDSEEVETFLRGKLPSYMIPFYYINLEAFPLTMNGKLDRKALPAPVKREIEDISSRMARNPIEELLVSIFENVLGRKKIGINDNFFALGGDSIKAIQIASRMYKSGYKLEIKQLFEYPQISQLSIFVLPLKEEADQGVVNGYIPLTPIQHEIFSKEMLRPNHYNQAVMLYSFQGFDKGAVEAVFKKIIEHHDVLRMSYSYHEGKWSQYNHDLNYPIELEEIDLKGCGDEKKLLNEEANKIQEGISLQKGPMVKLGLFHLTDGDRLLIVIHHFVVDTVSWRILFEDMESLYTQYKSNEELSLPLKSTSFKEWSEKLHLYAKSEALLEVESYWSELENKAVDVINKDYVIEGNYLKDVNKISLKLSQEETEQLLTKTNHAFNTEINDILLTGLGISIRHTFDIERVKIALEGHGREEIIKNIDISRTVGWFTSVYPIVLEVRGENLSYQVKEVKENLRRIPNKGIDYGILKYLSNKIKVISSSQKPEISFNYLGQFDSDITQRGFAIAEESAGEVQCLDQQRQYSIDVSGMIVGKQLTIEVAYNKNEFKLQTIEKLVKGYESQLKAIIGYCSSQSHSELTPSDLTYKKISIEEIALLSKEYKIMDIYPLTPLQEGLLFHTLYNPQSPAYFEQTCYRLVGVLDVEITQQSLNELIKRHGVLRTAFRHEFDRPLQILLEERQVDFCFDDISHIEDEVAQQLYISNTKDKDKERGFDLEKESLMRVTVLELPDNQYEFIWSHHHIIMDGWCTGILMQEYFEIYNSYKEKRSFNLSQPKEYRSYIKWLEKQDKDESRRYWQNYLNGYEEISSIPKVNGIGNKKGEYKLESIGFWIDEDNSKLFNRIGGTHQLTLNTIIQGIWAVLLGKYNNRTDVLFGSVGSGRPSEIDGVESIVGLFINTVPVRIRYEMSSSFLEVLKGIQKRGIESEQHQYYPLAEMQSESYLKQNLLDHLMIFENYPVEEQLLGFQEDSYNSQIKVSNIEVFEQTNYDLTVVVCPGKQIRINLNYNSQVYNKRFMDSIPVHFQQIVNQVLNEIGIEIGAIDLLTASEKSKLIEKFNPVPIDYPKSKTVHELFEEQARKTPNSIAVICENRKLTYRELNEKANQIAHSLRVNFEIKADDTLGLMTERSEAMIIGILGILKSGAAYLPLDPNFPKERIKYTVNDSGAKGILLQRKLYDSTWECPTLFFEDCLNQENIDNPTFVNTSENIIYLIYTSGSTGYPKGVEIRHQSVVNFLFSMKEKPGINASDRLLSLTTYSFDISVLELLLPLTNGAELIIVSQEKLQDVNQLREVIDAEKPTLMQATPSMWNMLLESGWVGNQNLKILCGGERMPYELGKRLMKNCSALWNMYGPTETTIWSTIKCIKEESDILTIGKPINNTSVFVLDEHLKLVPVGIPGELYIGGDGVAKGYHNRADLTAARFFLNPHNKNANEIIYRTGDVAKWLPGGDLEFLGRNDSQIKIRGYRIEYGEIENTLLRHIAIKEAAVLAKSENGEEYLVCFYVGKEKLDPQEIRAYLKASLPEYMVPQMIIEMDSFPLTPNGKVDRKALAAFDMASVTLTNDYTPPGNEIESKLAKIWENLLKKDSIGIHDNFFFIGGHSLKVTQLVSRINKEFDVKIEFKRVFELPTIAELSKHIMGLKPSRFKSIDILEEQEYYSVSPAQLSMWVKNHFEYEKDAYVIHSTYEMNGVLNKEAFTNSFRTLIQRHEILRTTFPVVGGAPKVKVNGAESFDFNINYIDLRTDNNKEDRIIDILSTESKADFDLETGPLLKGILIRSDDEKYVFLFVIHHIISDAWSMDIAVKEILALYHSYEHNTESLLPPLRIQFKDYIGWYHQQFIDSSINEHEAYWLELFKEGVPALNLPVDFERDKVKTTEAGSINLVLNKELTGKLRSISNEAGSTLFTTLFSSLNILLYHHTHESDIVIGSPVAGREHPDLEDQIGLYLNTLALRTRLDKEDRFVDLLKKVKINTLKAFEHQIYPLDSLIEKLSLKRNMSRSALFDIGFTWQNFEGVVDEGEITSFEKLSVSPAANNVKNVKTDLWLHAWETGEEIFFSFSYNKKLYKESTIKELISSFEDLISLIVTSPLYSIDDLIKRLTHKQKDMDELKQSQVREKNLNKFFNTRKKEIKVNEDFLIEKQFPAPDKSYPLIIKPIVDGVILHEWIKTNKSWVQKELLTTGAILLRDFKADSVELFREFSRNLSENQMNYFDQSSPRTQISDKLYTSTDHPADQKINMHNELSYSNEWPMQILFYCFQASEEGGQTPIADSRKVLDLLSQQTKDKFLEKGIMYVRNLIKGFGISWENVYQTSDKSEVEEYCKNNKIQFQWKGDNHLRISWIRPAIQRHPITKELTWFNHGFFFNASNLDSVILEVVGDKDNLPFNTMYGDGSPIEAEVIEELRGAYERTKEEFVWEPGDVLLLDNMLMAHGRNPYRGDRKILVSMNDPYSIFNN